MKRLLYLIVLLCGVFVESVAQGYSVYDIPDSLLKDSHLVVRNMELKVTVKSMTKAEVTCKKAITILDDFGQSALSFMTDVSKFESLKSFNASVYDINGQLIRKFKKSDLNYSELSSHLSTDIAHYYISLPVYSFPCTVEYEYTKTLQDFIASYPQFDAIPNYGGVSIQRASYTLNLLTLTDFNVIHTGKEISKTKINSDTKTETYQWNIEGIPAVKTDLYMPSIGSIMYITPLKCKYDDNVANFDSWGNFGIWMSSIMKGRDALPEELKIKVHKLTDNIASPKEKVKQLYKYMCENCRYVSIQVGIGGIQPMSATDVYNTKFGDCKALSFFLGSMLKEIGIKSNMVFISTKNERLNKEHVTLATTNHAILKVSLPDETLWLECTNSELPFGFIHNGINGHDAIIIDGENTCIETLPKSSNKLNSDIQVVNINIKPDDKTYFDIKRTCKMGEYDYVAGMNKDDIKKEFLKRVSIPNIVLNDINVNKSGDNCPEATISITANAYKYGTTTGKRSFIPVNPFRPQLNKLDKNRDIDIDIKYGYTQCDSITLLLPEKTIIESLPKNIEIENDFGKMKSEIIQQEGAITILQIFSLNSGVFDKIKAEEYNNLINAANSCYSAKLVIRKL